MYITIEKQFKRNEKRMNNEMIIQLINYRNAHINHITDECTDENIQNEGYTYDDAISEMRIATRIDDLISDIENDQYDDRMIMNYILTYFHNNDKLQMIDMCETIKKLFDNTKLINVIESLQRDAHDNASIELKNKNYDCVAELSQHAYQYQTLIEILNDEHSTIDDTIKYVNSLKQDIFNMIINSCDEFKSIMKWKE